MNLTEGTRLIGNPAVIPDSNRGDLPRFLAERGCRVGAEIGVYKGGFTQEFCKVGLKMYAIDPWQAFEGQGRTQNRQERQAFLYEHTRRTLAPYGDLVTIIRQTSMDALSKFRDRSLDFVYIDGDHTFPSIAADIYYWSQKVRKGGIVAGHDYFDTRPEAANVLCHVQVIVDAYARLFQIPNWWIFGVPDGPLEQVTKNDRFHSWMWIKP